MIDITWPIVQKKKEINQLQEFLSIQNIKTVLEIGTQYGGTALLWAKIIEKVDGHVYCIDSDFSIHRHYVGTPQERFITEIQGDSHSCKTIESIEEKVKLVDFLFIDGDHTYRGAKADFEIFCTLVKPKGFIAFHDIQNMFRHDPTYGVHKLWQEIKTQYTSWEFIDGKDKEYPKDYMGIGLIQTKE